jgi:hypothetical protein
MPSRCNTGEQSELTYLDGSFQIFPLEPHHNEPYNCQTIEQPCSKTEVIN